MYNYRSFVNAKRIFIKFDSAKRTCARVVFVILFQVLTIIYWGVVKGGGLSNQPSKYTMYHVLHIVLTRPLFLVLGVEGRGGGELVNVLFIYVQIE